MKIVLDLKNKPKKDDILVFDGEKFECISLNEILMFLQCESKKHKEDIELIKQEIKVLKGED